mgnify:CR=1 FL=1
MSTYATACDDFVAKVMCRPAVIDDLGDRLKPGMLITEGSRRVMEAVKAVKEADGLSGVNVLSVASYLQTRGGMEKMAAFDLATRYSDSTGLNALGSFWYVEAGYQLAQATRTVERVLQDLKHSPISDASGSIDDAVASLRVLEDSQPAGTNYNTAGHYAKEWVEDLQARAESGGRMMGTPTGYESLDEALGGWVPGNTYVLMAGTGVGKTATALNFATSCAALGHGVLVCSIEMGPSEIVGRMVASLGRVYASTFQRPRLKTGDGPDHPGDDKVFLNLDRTLAGVHQLRRFGDSLMLADETELTVESIRSMVREINRRRRNADKVAQIKAKEAKEAPPAPRGPLRLLIIDYLQLVGGDGGQKMREQEVAAISKGFKNLARVEDIAIIELSQINEHGRARESKQIENDASAVMLLEPTDPDCDDLDPEYQLKMPKNRHGAQTTPRFRFQKRFQRLVEID